MPNTAYKESNIDNVLTKSLFLFAEHGVANTTLEMISVASGVTTRSLHNYFETKEDLIDATFKKAINDGTVWYMKMTESEEYIQASGIDQIRFICETAFRYVRENVNLLCSIFSIAYANGTSFGPHWVTYHKSFETTITDIIEQALIHGINDGSVHSIPNTHICASSLMLTLHGLIHEFAYKLAIHEHDVSIENLVHEEMDTLVEFTLDSLKTH